MNNIKLYENLNNCTNSIQYNEDYLYKTKLNKSIIFNSNGKKFEYYFHLIKNYIAGDEYLSYIQYDDDTIINFILVLDKYDKLYCINSSLLYVASEVLYDSEFFLDVLKILLIPDEYKKENIYDYYYLKDYNLDNYNEKNKNIYDKYIKKDIERILFKNEILKESNFYSLDQDIQDAVWIMIIYCFDKNPVVDKKELKEFLINFMNHPKSFYNDYYLNGIRYLDDAYPDARDKEEKNLFYRYIEHFFDERNSYQKKKIK